MAWGAAISAGISALSQLAGPLLKHKKKINPILQRVNWAREAGIHPIYALGGGISNDGYAGSPIQWGDALGAALSEVGRGVGGVYDEMQTAEQNKQYEAGRQRERAEDRMFQREMANRGNESERLDNEYKRALIEEVRSRTQLQQARAGSAGASVGGNISGNMPVRIPFSNKVIEPTDATSAQDVQNRYDDWVSGLFGLAQLFEDVLGQSDTDVLNKRVDEFFSNFKKGAQNRLPMR